jgi:hypothetical protein
MLFAIVGLLFVTSAGRTELRWLGAEGPPFAFVADATDGMHPGDELSLVVALGGRYPTPATVTAHLSIPAGLHLQRGDTTIVGPLNKVRGNWTLVLRPTQVGRYEVRGQVAIDAGARGIDEAEFTMSVEVRSDTVIVEHSRYSRIELRKGGQRFRYGDWWLVPLDSTEAPVVEADIESRGSHARAASQVTAVCEQCPTANAPDSVHFVVAIGPDGLVRDWKLLGSSLRRGRRPSPAVADAAEAALRRMTFQPAQANGQAVSDCIFVSIPVRQGP